MLRLTCPVLQICVCACVHVEETKRNNIQRCLRKKWQIWPEQISAVQRKQKFVLFFFNFIILRQVCCWRKQFISLNGKLLALKCENVSGLSSYLAHFDPDLYFSWTCVHTTYILGPSHFTHVARKDTDGTSNAWHKKENWTTNLHHRVRFGQSVEFRWLSLPSGEGNKTFTEHTELWRASAWLLYIVYDLSPKKVSTENNWLRL